MMSTHSDDGDLYPFTLIPTFIFPRDLMNALDIDVSKVSEHINPVIFVHKVSCYIPLVSQ